MEIIRFAPQKQGRLRADDLRGTPLKIVYLILAHHDEHQFDRLVEALDGADVFVHVDACSDIAPFIALGDRPGVHFLRERVQVYWGGWSIVEATLRLMGAAAHHLEADDYVVLLSGDSYPLQYQAEIAHFLEKYRGSQHINMVRMPSVDLSKPLTRMSRLHVEYDPRNRRRNVVPKLINRAKIPRNYRHALGGREPYAGSAWWALTGAAVHWLLEETERDRTFARFCRRTRIPDEFFFQTLLGGSPFMEAVRRTIMYTDWSRSKGPSPAVLDGKHVDMLAKSGLVADHQGYGKHVALFARKVGDEEVCALIRCRLWHLRDPSC